MASGSQVQSHLGRSSDSTYDIELACKASIFCLTRGPGCGAGAARAAGAAQRALRAHGRQGPEGRRHGRVSGAGHPGIWPAAAAGGRRRRAAAAAAAAAAGRAGAPRRACKRAGRGRGAGRGGGAGARAAARKGKGEGGSGGGGGGGAERAEAAAAARQQPGGQACCLLESSLPRPGCCRDTFGWTLRCIAGRPVLSSSSILSDAFLCFIGKAWSSMDVNQDVTPLPCAQTGCCAHGARWQHCDLHPLCAHAGRQQSLTRARAAYPSSSCPRRPRPPSTCTMRRCACLRSLRKSAVIK